MLIASLALAVAVALPGPWPGSGRTAAWDALVAPAIPSVATPAPPGAPFGPTGIFARGPAWRPADSPPPLLAATLAPPSEADDSLALAGGPPAGPALAWRISRGLGVPRPRPRSRRPVFVPLRN